MNRSDFEKRAIREAEKRLEIPSGWWGTWRDVHGPHGQRVRMTGTYYAVRWIVSLNGRRVSAHDSRAYAIKKAAKL